VNGLQESIVGLRITDVWSNYNSPYFKGSRTIKDQTFFKHFKKEVTGSKVVAVTRRAKNILIHLIGNSGTKSPAEKILLVHMKMTGHLLYGRYQFNSKNKKDPWEAQEPESLKDSYNQHVHFLISFSNKKQLALSDVRKFAKVTLIDSKTAHNSHHLNKIGPEPLEKSFTLDKFVARLNIRPNCKIKQALMDQSIIAGIGNIYADESLWRAGIHPTEKIVNITTAQLKLLFDAIKKTLSKGIAFGGDSTSDYRNIHGDKGRFHETHHAYQRTGTKCDQKGCVGTIRRIMIGSRSTHFCDTHQKLGGK
jgi:formamidopyrimidine-DNA glycosylase